MAALATLTLGDSERVRTHPALDGVYVRETLAVVAGAGQDTRAWALGMLDSAAGTLSDSDLGRATRLVLGVLDEVTR